MKKRKPSIHPFTLKRLSWLIRKQVLDEVMDEASDLSLEVVAEEIATGLVFMIRAEVLGLTRTAIIELDAPDGRWQSFKAALGLSYRKRKIRLNAFAIFPELPTEDDHAKVWLDATDATQTKDRDAKWAEGHLSSLDAT